MTPPLVPDVFDCHDLNLSPSIQADLLVKAKGAWRGLVTNALASEAYPIVKVVKKAQTGRTATLRRPRDTVDGTEGVVAHTHTRATIEEAADFFYIDTPAKAQQFARVMDELVEAKRTLFPLVDRPVVADDDDDQSSHDGGLDASAKPLDYLSVDWMMIKFKPGVPARDLCYLEIHKEFKSTCMVTGETRRGWVRGIHSVRLQCCPDMQDKYGVVRMEIQRSGHVFLETTEPGVLDYYKLYFGSPRGAFLGTYFNGMYLKGAMRTSARAILNLDEHFTTTRLRPILSTPLLVADVHAKTCTNCDAPFSSSWGPLGPKKSTCRACGHAICSKCRSLWALTLHGSTIQVPLCATCVGPTYMHDDAGGHRISASSIKDISDDDNDSILSTLRDSILSADILVEQPPLVEIFNGIDRQRELLCKMQERLATTEL
ncbi:Aste57867_19870 [Aphanomyces stellatus]|uniref:Aste57867_19870 protein n=1 Tax=Aphanomyces stellatus TaxID=120398 RepID=A0A485LDN6_9STRA|nr:hypothetical protein As57867_019804 [Aphanomyces stellatus]VFT96568.1 Aste57867_19870 [Aphanomyces stellatus]